MTQVQWIYEQLRVAIRAWPVGLACRPTEKMRGGPG